LNVRLDFNGYAATFMMLARGQVVETQDVGFAQLCRRKSPIGDKAMFQSQPAWHCVLRQ
jgi:hypothetical protein